MEANTFIDGKIALSSMAVVFIAAQQVTALSSWGLSA